MRYVATMKQPIFTSQAITSHFLASEFFFSSESLSGIFVLKCFERFVKSLYNFKIFHLQKQYIIRIKITLKYSTNFKY